MFLCLQDVINTIVQYSAPDFFSCDLPGASLLILDFIHAANMITVGTDLEVGVTISFHFSLFYVHVLE